MFYTEKAGIMPHVAHLDPNRLYAAKFDGNWLRIQLNSILNHATVIILLNDQSSFLDIDVMILTG